MKHLAIMNFDLSPSQRDLLAQAEKACLAIRPTEDHAYLNHSLNDKTVGILAKYNLLGVPIDEKYGGMGADTLSWTIVLQRLGKESAGLRMFLSSHVSLGLSTLAQWGSEEQKRKYLVPGARGQKIFCFALNEDTACSDPESMTTMYESKGKGKGFVLTGNKAWIPNATIADTIVTFAKNKKTGQYSAFIVDRKAKGVSASEEEDKVGLHSSSLGHVQFKQVILPQEALLGVEGSGLHIAYSALLNERLAVAAGCVGAMEDCLSESVEHAKKALAFGKEIGKHQLVQRHLAVMSSNCEAAKWLVYRAAVEKHHYAEHPNEKFLPYVDGLVCKAKWFAAVNSVDCASRAMQVAGEAGYSLKNRVGRHYCDLKLMTILEGTSEIMEQKIAVSLLGPEFKAFR
ncbi:MAG: acyl-CoA dehydrogenase family protein [Nanoarchaeota archaeon]